MTDFPYEPTSDRLIEPEGFDPKLAAEGLQTFRPAHYNTGRLRDEQLDKVGDMELASGWCSGCGERQIQIKLQGANGKYQWVKLRPSMAIMFGELLIIHGKAGSAHQ